MADQLFEELFKPGILYRLTGIVLSKLEADLITQYDLFDDVPKLESLKRIDRVLDGVNALYGKHALHLGTSLWLGKHRQHVAGRGDLPQRKAQLLAGETFRQHLGIPIWRVCV